MKEELSNVDRIAIEMGHAGRNTLAYVDDDRNVDRPFKLNTYRPYGYTPDRPVVIVQHGMLRNGDDYRDFWIPAADKHKVLIVAPTFSDSIWPGEESYTNGRVFSASGNPRHIDGWTYHMIAKVFADMREAGITEVEQAHLFGHSHGGEFVHRLASSQSHTPYAAITTGSSGWYTLPTFEHRFPEGLDGIGLTEEHLVRLLAYPMTILVGDQDMSTDDVDLPVEPAASSQGPHRFARAQHYFEAGQREAQRRGVPFNWTLTAVPGIGHDARAMSVACANLWFEGKLPSVTS